MEEPLLMDKERRANGRARALFPGAMPPVRRVTLTFRIGLRARGRAAFDVGVSGNFRLS